LARHHLLQADYFLEVRSGFSSPCCPPLKRQQHPCNRIGRRPHRVRFLNRINISAASDDATSFAARSMTTPQGLCARFRLGIIIITVAPIEQEIGPRTPILPMQVRHRP
jgi:hypothetical protein